MLKVQRYLDPTQASGGAFLTRGITGKVVMLNLLRCYTTADYASTPELASAEPMQEGAW